MLSNGHCPPYEIDHGPFLAEHDRYQVKIALDLHEIGYFPTFPLN